MQLSCCVSRLLDSRGKKRRRKTKPCPEAAVPLAWLKSDVKPVQGSESGAPGDVEKVATLGAPAHRDHACRTPAKMPQEPSFPLEKSIFEIFLGFSRCLDGDGRCWQLSTALPQEHCKLSTGPSASAPSGDQNPSDPNICPYSCIERREEASQHVNEPGDAQIQLPPPPSSRRKRCCDLNYVEGQDLVRCWERAWRTDPQTWKGPVLCVLSYETKAEENTWNSEAGAAGGVEEMLPQLLMRCGPDL